jgi:hypothetical protein
VLDFHSLLAPSNSARTGGDATLASYSFTGRHTLQAVSQGCDFFQFCISKVKVPASRAEPLRTTLPTEDVADELMLEVRFSNKVIDGGVKCYCLVSWNRVNKAWMGNRFPDLFAWMFELSVPKGSSHLRLLVDPPLRVVIGLEICTPTRDKYFMHARLVRPHVKPTVVINRSSCAVDQISTGEI